MFKYLYYKLYRAALKSSLKDIPHIAAACWLGCLTGLNILAVDALLSKTTPFPWFFKNYKTGVWFALVLIILLFLYFTKQKREFIIKKYSEESDQQRMKANVIVAVYVALTLILTFVIAFYRPGKF